jgi:hypothetical protein
LKTQQLECKKPPHTRWERQEKRANTNSLGFNNNKRPAATAVVLSGNVFDTDKKMTTKTSALKAVK